MAQFSPGWYLCEDCGSPVPAETEKRIIDDDDGIERIYCKLCAEERKATLQ